MIQSGAGGFATVANQEDFKPGDLVWIKNPHNYVHAKVIGLRPGAGSLPEDQLWELEVLPRKLYLRADDFEPVHPPKDPNAPLKYMSREWVEQLAAFNDSAARYLADNNDKAAMKAALESLIKLGYVK